MTFPKLRFPTWGEIVALFHVPSTVSHAIASIEAAARRTEDVIAHNLNLADENRVKAGALAAQATAANLAADNHQEEAARGSRVVGKLRDLIA